MRRAVAQMPGSGIHRTHFPLERSPRLADLRDDFSVCVFLNEVRSLLDKALCQGQTNKVRPY